MLYLNTQILVIKLINVLIKDTLKGKNKIFIFEIKCVYKN